MMIWFHFSHFVVDIYNALLELLMPYIAEKLDFSVGVGVLILNITYILGNILQPIFGAFADRTNKLVFVFFGLVLASVFLPLTTVADDVSSLLMFAVFGAIGVGLYHPQSMGNMQHKMGVFLMAGTLGYSAAPLLIIGVKNLFGYDAIPYVSIIGLCVAASMIFLPAQKITTIQEKKRKTPFKLLLKEKGIRELMTMSIGAGVIIYSFGQITPFLWKEMGKEMSYSGIGLFTLYTAGAIGEVCVESFRKRIGRNNTFFYGLIALAVAIAMFILTHKHEYISMIFLAAVGFISMGLFPLLITTGQEILPQDKSAISGIVSGFSYAVSCTIAVGFGFLCDFIGIIPSLCILCFIPLICCFMVKDIRRNYFTVFQ